MKKIYLNLKRFDIPQSFGGINKDKENETYGAKIAGGIEKMNLSLPVTIYFQESNLLSALSASKNVKIGHLNYLFGLAGGKGDINKILNEEIKRAQEAGLEVLYCIGEKAEEQDHKYDVLKHQLLVGLEGIDLSKVTIAYEPVWAIGPGKVPPGREYIEDIARFIKSVVNCPVVYGGGLKIENAEMIASIPEVDGGLIALTKFGADFGFTLEDFEKIVLTYEKGLKK